MVIPSGIASIRLAPHHAAWSRLMNDASRVPTLHGGVASDVTGTTYLSLTYFKHVEKSFPNLLRLKTSNSTRCHFDLQRLIAIENEHYEKGCATCELLKRNCVIQGE
ncbi:hypothetical protein DPMN_126178 [Dreissena polymorpha]|uniref:Uncharacterized protein n=1 Tax=Dreissena polymorpha TaxID=45954 RepID=A0A9D4JXW1_DREPO|nr:hypothetical protein DPMN_126178 [Dreissena polymorpha]